MSNVKQQAKLQSRGEQDPTLSKGAVSERENSTNRPGTGAYEKVKPASLKEDSPNTPTGEDL